jgi:hypothetical protein
MTQHGATRGCVDRPRGLCRLCHVWDAGSGHSRRTPHGPRATPAEGCRAEAGGECYRQSVIRLRIWLSILVVALMLLPSCQEATQITLDLHTNFESTAGVQVAVWVGPQGLLPGEPTTRVDRPWGTDGALGSLVVVPPDDQGAGSVRLRAVLNTNGPPEACATQIGSCVVAERLVGFEKFRGRRVPVGLYRSCLGIACGDGTTCNYQGQCVPAAVDGDACLSEQGCAIEGDPIAPPGVIPDNPVKIAPDDAFVPPALDVAAPTVTFRDSDPREGFTQGTAQLSAASVAGRVQGFRLYWATDAQRGALFATAAAGSDGTSSHIFLPGSRLPIGLAFVEVTAVASDVYGQTAESKGTRVRVDNYLRKMDIGADAGGDALSQPHVLGDPIDNALLLIGSSSTLTLRHCNADGTGCAARELTAQSAVNLYFAFDTRTPSGGLVGFVRGNPTSLFVRCTRGGKTCSTTPLDTTNNSGGLSAQLQGPWLLVHFGSVSNALRCNIDTGTCSAVPLPGLSTDTLGRIGGIAQDPASQDVIVLAPSDAGRMLLFRCPASGIACVGKNVGVGFTGALALDEGRSILHITFSSSSVAVPNLTTQCSLDTTLPCSTVSTTASGKDCVPVVDSNTGDTIAVCTGTDQSGDYVFAQRCPPGVPCQPIRRIPDVKSTWHARAATLNGQARLLVGYVENFFGRPWVVNCNIDGADCARSDVSVASIRGNTSSGKPALGFDFEKQRVHVVTTNGAAGDRASLFSCGLEGQSCKHRTLEGLNGDGRDPSLGESPSLVVDGTRGTLTIVTRDGGNRGRASAFFCNRDGESCRFVPIQAEVPAGGYSDVAGAVIGQLQGKTRLIVGAATTTDRLILSCTLSGTDCRQHAAFPLTAGGNVRRYFDWNATLGTAEFLTDGGAGRWRCRIGDSACSNIPPTVEGGFFVFSANTLDAGGYATLHGSFGGFGLPLQVCEADTCHTRLNLAIRTYFTPNMSAAFDAKRGIRYFAIGYAATPEQSLYRCPPWPAACERIASWADDAESTMAVLEATDTLYVAAKDSGNLNRPMLLTMDLY